MQQAGGAWQQLAALECTAWPACACACSQQCSLTPLSLPLSHSLLSLSSCLQVFPQLYLPVMEEGNKRVLRPHRKYLPTPSWFSFKLRMARLNAFLTGLIRERWAARQTGDAAPRGDILDRILQAIEVRGCRRALLLLLVLLIGCRSAAWAVAALHWLSQPALAVAALHWLSQNCIAAKHACIVLATTAASTLPLSAQNCSAARPATPPNRHPPTARRPAPSGLLRLRRSCATRSKHSCSRGTRRAQRC